MMFVYSLHFENFIENKNFKWFLLTRKESGVSHPLSLSPPPPFQDFVFAKAMERGHMVLNKQALNKAMQIDKWPTNERQWLFSIII